MSRIIFNEIKHNFKKKGTIAIFFITELICILWIIINYNKSNTVFKLGSTYQDSGLNMFEIGRIFYNYMLYLTTTIYIFPFIILGVVLVAGDIHSKIYINLYTVTQRFRKYITAKAATLLIFNSLLLIMILITCSISSFVLPNVNNKTSYELINIYFILSFIIYLLGISALGFFSMGIAYYLRSSMAGALVSIYILAERIFTSMSAIALQNPYIMKFNEYLPWCNFNTLFVYASNLRYLTSSLSKEEMFKQASILTMFKIIKYNNTYVAYPFFKELWKIILICLLYLLLFILIFYLGVKKSIKEGGDD